MGELLYSSTRGGESGCTASEAVLKGLAKDGGLFMPERIPRFDFALPELKDASYQEVAYRVMRLLLTDYSEEELRACIEGAYDEKFDTPEIAPLTFADDAYYLELFHGKTIAFKDMALSILPYLMTTAAKKNGVTNKIEILTATSGDTGSAAEYAMRGKARINVFMLSPHGRMSPFQQAQMYSLQDANIHNIAIEGVFDDCQDLVKAVNADAAYKSRHHIGAVNSINWARVLAQSVYYTSSSPPTKTTSSTTPYAAANTAPARRKTSPRPAARRWTSAKRATSSATSTTSAVTTAHKPPPSGTPLKRAAPSACKRWASASAPPALTPVVAATPTA